MRSILTIVVLYLTLPLQAQYCVGNVVANFPKDYFYIDSLAIEITLGANLKTSNTFDFRNNIYWEPNDFIGSKNILDPIVSIGKSGLYSYVVYDEQVNYKSKSLINNGSFEDGNVGFSSEYGYVAPGVNILDTTCRYSITEAGKSAWNLQSNFAACGPQNGLRYMVVNGAGEFGKKIWCQTVPVLANSSYQASCSATSVRLENPALLGFSINGELLGNNFGLSPSTCGWQQITETWYSDSHTSATVCLLNYNLEIGGNKFAVDNLRLTKITTDSCELKFRVFKRTGSDFISGRVLNACRQFIAKVPVQLIVDDQVVATDTSDILGFFSFQSISTSATSSQERFKVKAVFDKNVKYCTSTKDLLLIKQHILNIVSFDKYRFAVADVNRDGKITTADLLEIQQVILQRSENYLVGPKTIFVENAGQIKYETFLSIPKVTMGPYTDLEIFINSTGDVDCSCK